MESVDRKFIKSHIVTSVVVKNYNVIICFEGRPSCNCIGSAVTTVMGNVHDMVSMDASSVIFQ